MTEPGGDTRTIHDGGGGFQHFFWFENLHLRYFFGLRSVMYFGGFISLFD